MTTNVQLKAFRREGEVAAQARDTFQACPLQVIVYLYPSPEQTRGVICVHQRDVSPVIIIVNYARRNCIGANMPESRACPARQAAMANDPIACYLVKGSSIGRFWDVMITQYLTPTQSELNFITEGAKAAVLARVYPDEKVCSSPSFASIAHLRALAEKSFH